MLDLIKDTKWFSGPMKMHIHQGNEKLVVVTGSNASGKSLLRKILTNRYKDKNIEVIHLSMSSRASSGFERVVIYGSEDDDATGYNSIKTFLKAIETSISRTNEHIIIFDEPEIGCSDEVAMALGQRLFDNINSMTCKVVYVISHSRKLVEQLAPFNPTHISLGVDQSLQDWLKRDIIPANLEQVLETGRINWKFVQGKLNGN